MLRNRMAKLEAENPKPDNIRIGIFLVAPGCLNPTAYECEGITTYRRNDESEESFIQRCYDSLKWECVDMKTFHPVDI